MRPAIGAHRAEPQQDVISHLLEQDYSDGEILMECITYGAAGMVTTREVLQITTWHLLARPDLRAAFLAGDTAQRSALLHEVLRLEPVVGHLYRRTGAELVLTDGDVEHRVPDGARLDLYIRSANADPDHVTPDPLALRPGRDLPSGIRAEVMSFGDGPHRCPGNAVAMAESEIFLERLLARDVEMVGEPRLEWEDLIAGYAVRGLVLRDRGGRWSPPVGETEPMSEPHQPEQTPEPTADDAGPSQEAVDLAHALFDLARRGDADRLAAYVDAGAPADLSDPQGNTLLMLAAYHGHAQTVRVLAQRGADVDRLNDRGQSPLAGAVFKGEDEVVATLLEHRADPDVGQPTARQTAQMFDREDLLGGPNRP